MGPIIIFDKSALESFSVDEVVWLDRHFSANITPLFFVEVLADLEKEVSDGRTPEQIVGKLAEKTPDEGRPNVHHETLSVDELLGNRFELRGVPALGGGQPVESDGRRGIVFKESPEMAALSRWQRGKFLDLEREFARVWRKALSGIDLEAIYREGRAIVERMGRPRDLSEAKALAVALHSKPGSRSTREALHRLDLPDAGHREIIDRWRAAGEPPIRAFAPFTAHVMTVDSFFTVALGAGHIGRERPTNKIDIAYLYYLPFCMVFTSKDRLHERTAPLFLSNIGNGRMQEFLWAEKLKADLAKLNAHYSALPDEVKARGAFSFAAYPPAEGGFLTSALWDRFMRPDWREHSKQPKIEIPKDQWEKMLSEINQMADAPRAGGEFSVDETHATLFQMRVAMRKGNWRLLPPEIEEESSKDDE